MRIRSVKAKAAPSLDLVPETKHQILVDRDLADVIKRVAGALGYRSMSGLLNDALVYYLSAEYPHLELVYDLEDEVRRARASADAKQRRLDDLAEAGQRLDQSGTPERRQAERRTKKGTAALWSSEGNVEQRTGRDRRSK